MTKEYAPIGNLGLNFPHWVAKGEEAFIKYFSDKNQDGSLKVKTYETLFTRRTEPQRIELLKQHFGIMKNAVGAPEMEVKATEPKGKTTNKGAE